MLQGNIKLRLSLSWNETPVRERHNASAETQYFRISCHESAERTKTSASSEKGAARLFTSDLWFEGFNLGSESRDFFFPFQQLLHCFCGKTTKQPWDASLTERADDPNQCSDLWLECHKVFHSFVLLPYLSLGRIQWNPMKLLDRRPCVPEELRFSRAF